MSASRSIVVNIKLILTGLQLNFFCGCHGHQSTQPLGLPLLFVNLRSELVCFPTQSLCVGFKSHKFISPEIRFSHQEVKASRESTNLCFKVISSVNERGGTL